MARTLHFSGWLVVLAAFVFAVSVASSTQAGEQPGTLRAQQEEIRRQNEETLKSYHSQFAAATKEAKARQEEAQVAIVARRLPGPDGFWYVLVLQSKTDDSKSRELVVAYGKIAAAKAIVDFLKRNPRIAANPQSYSRWLSIEWYPWEFQARARQQAILAYSRRAGYR